VKHLLVATDFSDEAERAIGMACLIASKSGATVTVAHVVAEKGRDFTDAHDRLEAQSLRMKRVSGATTQIVTAIGQPAERLVRLAHERRADLIMVAASSKTQVQKWLIGSTATQLLRSSPVPVLVMGSGMRPEINTIVVGCAYTPECAGAYRAADAMGAAFGASVEVVHISSDPGGVAIVAGSSGIHSLRAEESRLASWCAEVIPAPASKLEVRHLVSDDPGPTLVDHVGAVNADLVALGAHGRGFLSRIRSPQTGEVLLKNVYCGLLSVGRATT
jgi:nucleotide-binding universal stress UspA family protein